MRGKARAVGHRKEVKRITPAHAGKSRPDRRANRQLWDHPRACGEKLSRLSWPWHLGGSPPRMRGKAEAVTFPSAPYGITPAHAGKSRTRFRGLQNTADHPRACGEKLYTPCIIACRVGSPPRMRGKGITSSGGFPWQRITPAHAGKSGVEC